MTTQGRSEGLGGAQSAASPWLEAAGCPVVCKPRQNVFSVDVEDYFQVGLFEDLIDRERWDDFELRVERNTDRLLELLDRHRVEATFFVLGWIAERCPALIRRIHQGGHELALHGYDHRRITEQDRRSFRDDVRHSRSILEDISGAAVVGYRAPSYSVVQRTLWALEVLAEEGFLYDSSIFPIRHDHYGIAEAPRHPWRFEHRGEGLIEFPASTVRLLGMNLPFVGGGYLRQFPQAFVEWGMRRVEREGLPVMLYVHPWEIDPEQPRQAVGWLGRLRHYRNLDKTEERLERLCRRHRFTSVRRSLGLPCETGETP